ncbi:MAG: hypothetical protein ACK55I_36450, partial [bacterium]
MNKLKLLLFGLSHITDLVYQISDMAQSFRFEFAASFLFLATAENAAKESLLFLFGFLRVFLLFVDDCSLLYDFTSPSLKFIKVQSENNSRPKSLLR